MIKYQIYPLTNSERQDLEHAIHCRVIESSRIEGERIVVIVEEAAVSFPGKYQAQKAKLLIDGEVLTPMTNEWHMQIAGIFARAMRAEKRDIDPNKALNVVSAMFGK